MGRRFSELDFSAPKSRVFSEADFSSESGGETKGLAALQGAGKELTLGYLPELQAGAERLINKVVPNKVDQGLEEQGFTVSQPDTATTKFYRDRQKQLSEAEPGAFMGGQVAGIIASSAPIAKMTSAALRAPGLAGAANLTAKAPGLIQKGAQGAAAAIPQAAAYNPIETGMSRAESGLQAAATGGLIGSGLGAVQSTLKGVASAGSKAKEAAGKLALRSLGIYGGQASKIAKNEGAGKLKELGGYVLEKGLIQSGDDIEDIALRTASTKKEVGQKIGKIFQETTEALSETPQGQALSMAGFSPVNVLDDVSNAQSIYRGTPQGASKAKALESVFDDFSGLGESPTFDQVQGFKERLDDIIFKNQEIAKRGGVLPAGTEALADFREILKNRLQGSIQALEDLGGKQNLDLLKGLNREYGLINKADAIAKERAAKELGNNYFSLRDTIWMGAGAAGGAASGDNLGDSLERAAKGAIIGAGARGLRKYGMPVLTETISKTGGLLQKIPKSLPDLGGLFPETRTPLPAILSERLLRPEKPPGIR